MTLEEALEKLNSGNCPSGLELNLRWSNSIYSTSPVGNKGAQALAEALASGNCPSGLHLEIGDNDIGNKGSNALAEALTSGKCPSKLHLDINANNLYDNGTQAFAKALALGYCPLGLYLDISANNIRNKGAQALAVALRSGKCPRGLTLNLITNYIDDIGTEALAGALNSGHCRFRTTIIKGDKKYDFFELRKENNRRIQKLTSLQLVTLIGGYSQCKRPVPLSVKSILPEDIVNHIATFLPGNITVFMILNKLKLFFSYALNNTADFSDEFLKKYRGVNQKLQNKYDKKYGLSLWKYKENHRKQFHKNNPRRNGYAIL